MSADHDRYEAVLRTAEALYRDGSSLDLRNVRSLMNDFLNAVNAFASPMGRDPYHMEREIGFLTDDCDYDFERAIEDAENPDTLAATEADHRRDMNR